MNARVVTRSDREWPAQMEELDPQSIPERLFLDGDPLPSKEQCIAIVGTRRPTASGIEIACQFARAFAESGFTVVSGMALGIDAAAHRAALDSGGKTIAVLGCGLDICYPKRNRTLYKTIPTQGTLVTEYEAGVQPHRVHFPTRNRIIAGLCEAVVVIEGGLKSGALITARLAADAGREVFAVPGSPFNAVSLGPNELIRVGEAALVIDPQQIFEVIAPKLVWTSPYSPTGKRPDLNDDELAVLTRLDVIPASMDRLVATTGLKPGAVSLTLAKLQLRGFATRASTGGFAISPAGARATREVPLPLDA